MKTTKQLVDEDFERIHLLEEGYINAEKEHEQLLLMQQIYEEEERDKAKMAGRYAKIVLGKARRRVKFTGYAKVTLNSKLPRYVKNLQRKTGGT